MDEVVDMDRGPDSGGRWIRNPETGELTRAPDDAPAPADPAQPEPEPEQEQP